MDKKIRKGIQIGLFAITYLTLARLAYGAETYFTPGNACENQIVSAIHGARKEIRIAVYSINNQRIVETLKSANRRGIKIRILTDRVQAAGRSSRVLELLRTGLDLRVHSISKIMHMKVGARLPPLANQV